ncbi:MAG: hypothetical protein WAV32_02745, partial [Halobacteriota archaeon]
MIVKIHDQYSNNNRIYLNNFINACFSPLWENSTNIWNSAEKITYVHNNTTYTNYLGNFWDEYTNIDANNDGIWDNPRPIDSDRDYYPLVEPFENYTISPTAPINFDIRVEPSVINASIGSSITLNILIKNNDTRPETFTISVSGIPEKTFYLESEEVSLTAGEERRVALHLYIPQYLDYKEVVKISVKPSVDEEKSVYATINVIPYPIIKNLSPADNITTGSTNVIISWTTTTNASSEVYYRMEGEPAFNITTGDFGKEHIIELKNLTRKKAYLWYVKSCNAYGCAQSEIRRFFVSNGIVFTQREYTFNIERDLNQQVEVSVENTDTKTHTMLLQVHNPYEDIYVGFVGSGSTDEIVPLEPGERMDVDLVIHAQDASSENYTLFINLTCTDENITDFAIAHANVRFPVINFSIAEIGIDPLTLSKTFRITNYGDTLTDLRVESDDSLKGKVILQPTITHGILNSGGYLDVTVSPMWKDIKNITGNLIVSAAGVTKTVEVKFECSGGKELYEVILENPILYFDLKSGFCINSGHVEDYFHLPPGFDADDVKYAFVGVELNAGAGQTTPYDVTIAINGNAVGTLKKAFPRGYYEFEIAPSYLNYALVGTAKNRFTLDTNMNRGYSTSLS